MPFEIVKNDICNMHVDAIVNTANPYPVVGHGVDFGIHQRAGKQLLEARKKIGEIAFGDVAITPAYELDAKYVIHSVSPVWLNGQHNEAKLLEQCYEKSLSLALEHECKSIAFPLLASGNNAFPKELALQVAINAFSNFLLKHDMQIYLTVFDHFAVSLSEKLFKSIESYIDEHYIQEIYHAEYELPDFDEEFKEVHARKRTPPERLRERRCFETFCQASNAVAATLPRNLDDLMNELDEGFSESFLRLLAQKGLKASDLYNTFYIDRKLFSKIKTKKDYQPSKKTCIALALAMQLNLDEARDLIEKAGYTLTNSSLFDLLVMYCIQEKIYNIIDVDHILYKYHQSTFIS